MKTAAGLSEGSGGHTARRKSTVAMTLIELLVVMAIISVLMAMLVPSLVKARGAARQTCCMNQLRQLALAVRFYADDNDDQFPRSEHSAFSYRQQPWGFATLPFLGHDRVNRNSPAWPAVFNGIYRCPEDRRTNRWSYGLNVYFELGSEDDYRGTPSTWRKVSAIPQPSGTILFGEMTGAADHVMAHFWDQGATPEVATNRHRGRSEYVFVDGYVTSCRFCATYQPCCQTDLWNPYRGR